MGKVWLFLGFGLAMFSLPSFQSDKVEAEQKIEQLLNQKIEAHKKQKAAECRKKAMEKAQTVAIDSINKILSRQAAEVFNAEIGTRPQGE